MSVTKKAALGVVGILVLGGLILGTNLSPYSRTAIDEARQAVEESIPEEFQLKTAKNMLENELMPEISRMKTAVASARVDVRELTAKLDERAGNVAKSRDEMMTRTEQLKSGKTTFVINDVTRTKTELEEDLANRFKQFKLMESTLKSEDQVLRAKKDALARSEEKVEELLKARTELELHIEQLEARLTAVKASETITGSEFDESKLKRVKDMIAGAEHKIEVREEALAIEGETTGLIPVESDATGNIADEVNAYFGNAGDTGNVAETETVDEPANN